MSKFEGGIRNELQTGILFDFKDYLELVDTIGRIIRSDKRGAIPLHFPAILERLNIEPKAWLQNATQFEALYNTGFHKKRRARPDQTIDLTRYSTPVIKTILVLVPSWYRRKITG